MEEIRETEIYLQELLIIHMVLFTVLELLAALRAVRVVLVYLMIGFQDLFYPAVIDA